MNAMHIEGRAQRRAMGLPVGAMPKLASRFNPDQLRGKNAARWEAYQQRRAGHPARLQLWAAP